MYRFLIGSLLSLLSLFSQAQQLYSTSTDKIRAVADRQFVTQTEKDLIKAARTSAILLGTWNPATNTPALTASASSVTAGGYYVVSAAANAPFAGSNFTTSTALSIGDQLAKVGAGWVWLKNTTSPAESHYRFQKWESEYLGTGINLLNPKRITQGTLHRTGTVDGTVTTYYVTDYMPVTPGGQIICSVTTQGDEFYPIVFFDVNQALVGYSTGAPQANTAYPVPANAAYARITISTLKPATTTMVVADPVSAVLPSAFREFGEGDPLLAFQRGRVLTAPLPKTRNLFDPSATSPGALNVNNVIAAGTESGYMTSDYLPVTPGKVLRANQETGADVNYPIVFYDYAKKFLFAPGAKIQPNATYPVPSGAYFARFCVRNDLAPTMMLVEGALPTTYEAFALADAASVAFSVREGLSAAVPKTRNLFDASATVPGAIHNTNAVEVGQTNYVTSDYLPVTPGKVLRFNQATGGNNDYSLLFFDYAKKFISATGATVQANTAYSVPANAYYARTCVRLDMLAGMMIVEGTLPARYQAFERADVASVAFAVRDALTAALPKTRNLFDLNATIPGALNVNNVIAAGSESSYVTSDYLPVTPGKVLRANQETGADVNYPIVFYDYAKKLLFAPGAKIQPNATYPVPSGAYFARFCVRNDLVPTMMLVEGTLPGTYQPFLQSSPARRWQGKSLGALGDSQTANNIGQQLVAAQLGANLTYNNGVSGQTFATMTPTVSATALAGVDLLIVYLGVNDFSQSRTLGALGDAVGANTFYGDVRKMIETCLTAKPAIRLTLLTPPYQQLVAQVNNNGNTLRQYADAIIAVAAIYGCPVLDLNRLSGINIYNAGIYTSDGLHLNVTGWTAITPMITKFLENY